MLYMSVREYIVSLYQSLKRSELSSLVCSVLEIKQRIMKVMDVSIPVHDVKQICRKPNKNKLKIILVIRALNTTNTLVYYKIL